MDASLVRYLEVLQRPLALVEGERVLWANAALSDLLATAQEDLVGTTLPIAGGLNLDRIRRSSTEVALRHAMLHADLIILGPGSLYTSVLATALAPGVADAISSSKGMVVFVANLAPQEAETRGYDQRRTLEALLAHNVVPDVVLVHRDAVGAAWHGQPFSGGPRHLELKLSEDGLVHSPVLLADALARALGGDGESAR